MKKIYMPGKAALAFFNRPATPSFWDQHWEVADLRAEVTRCHDGYIIPFIRRYLTPAQGPLLEGGCGLGYFVHCLNEQGYRVIGVDFAEQTVQGLNRSLPELDIRVGDVRALSFEDNFFSGYMSLGVIEHFWGGYDAIAAEMRRVIKPGGFLFLAFPHMSPLRHVKAQLGFYRGGIPAQPEATFYQFALDTGRVLADFEQLGFRQLEQHAYDGIKGFKDEVPLGRAWLQALYEGKRPFRHQKMLDSLLRPFASHVMILVLQKRP